MVCLAGWVGVSVSGLRVVVIVVVGVPVITFCGSKECVKYELDLEGKRARCCCLLFLLLLRN